MTQSPNISLPVALFKGLRPKQIPKNLFVYVALVFSNNLFNPKMLGMVTVAFLLFCLVAGSVYLMNDILDVEADRQHPKKRLRPIASGALPIHIAKAASVLLMVGSVGASFAFGWQFGAVVLCYLVLQIFYCFRGKHIVLVDVFTLAAGFVLRVVAGAAIIHVRSTPWLLLFSFQLALFLGFGKRRQEIVLLGADAEKQRAILEEYSLPFLDQIIVMIAGITIVCYSVYSVQSGTSLKLPHLWATTPLVIYGVCRYLYLVYQKGWGGAPDEALREDRALQVVIAIWLALVLILFKFDRPFNINTPEGDKGGKEVKVNARKNTSGAP